MILLITDRQHECSMDEQLFTIEEFNDITYHPYIQSIAWDTVYIDLDNRINRGFVKQILGRKSKIVPVLINEVITPQNVLTLIEIAPDYAAKLIRAQAESQEKVHELFSKLVELYQWK